MRRVFVMTMVLVLLLSACVKPAEPSSNSAPSETVSGSPPITESAEPESEKPRFVLAPFTSLFMNRKSIIRPNEYDPEDIVTFEFEEKAVFEGSEALAKEILENGKNPGLGIRALHEQGITGEGVTVAIIDQNMFLDHPEYEGKIVEYYRTAPNPNEAEGSMHGPGVTSLLVGETVGTAPGAKVYYAEEPAATKDSKYGADAIYWFIEKNKSLPEGEKIRIISNSSSPSGEYSMYSGNEELYEEAVLAAQVEGILVIDSRLDADSGFVVIGSYDVNDPENVEKCEIGFPDRVNFSLIGYPKNMIDKLQLINPDKIVVPSGYRTVAREATEGDISYLYTGGCSLSWSIPYAAGVLAMGFQVNPDLTNDEIIQLLFDSAYVTAEGANIIDPPAFIDAVRGTL